MGLSGAVAITMMAQPQFSLLALGIGTTAAAGIGIGTEIMEYQNKITGTEDYTWSNVFKKILVGASAFSKYSSDVLDSPLGLFDSRTWVSFLTGWEPDTRTKKSYSTWLKEAVRGDFGNVVRDLENTGKVSDTEQYWIDLSTEIARNVPGSGEPSAY